MKKLILSLLLFFAVERFCHSQTGSFSLPKMLLDAPLATINPAPEFFSQPLTFIGAGNQFYAFETADHQYVVKFMKFSRTRPLPWLEKISLPSFLNTWKQNYLAQRAKRLANLTHSSNLALQYLSEETGLVPCPPAKKTILLIDKLGIHHQIDLARTRFLVQKKAESFTIYFQQNPSEAKHLISSYIQTVASQCKKGICNLDPVIDRNYGIVDRKIILMDVGSFLSHEKLKTSVGVRQEIFMELLPLREWLQDHHPKYVADFDHELKNLLQSRST
jgi:hypothetical protein